MTRRLTIVSDGTAANTRVLDARGDPVKWGNASLVKIEILPIQPDGVVSAVLHLDMVGLHLDAEGTPLHKFSADQVSASTITGTLPTPIVNTPSIQANAMAVRTILNGGA